MKYGYISFIKIISFLISIRIILVASSVSGGVIDYGIWLVSLIYTINYLQRNPNKSAIQFFKYFIILAFVQTIGITQIATFFSLRNIFASICIGCFFLNVVISFSERSYGSIIVCLFITFFFASYMMISSIKLENTLPACVMFIGYFNIMVSMWDNRRKTGKKIIVLIKRYGVSFTHIVLMFCSSFQTSARTAMLVAIVVIVVYFIFKRLKPKKRTMEILFWVLIVFTFIITLMYMHIDSFSWYEKVNRYSLDLFNKNIDSSRPHLWRESIKELTWWQYIIGGGTGRLPSIQRYSNSSFHNSYIQLFMQNGIIGLTVLVLLFRKIWFTLCKHMECNSIVLCIAIFIGIIIYNTMECTLLQNKAFLGITQWLCLGVGVKISYLLDRQNQKRICK